MKRFLALILAMLILMSLIACDDTTDDSDYDDYVDVETSATGTTDSSGTDNSDNKEPWDGTFKVKLMMYGEPFYVAGAKPVTVVWNDGISYVEVQADNKGVAVAEGLDGNYVVTLKDIPSGYTYNPNPYNVTHKTYGNIATNDQPEITINLYKLGETQGAGNDLQNGSRCVLRTTNVYRATLTSSEQRIYFEFAPKASGTYTIESWMPVTDDKVNPIIDVYSSNFAAPIYQYTLDTGGAEGKSYTKNFKYEVEIADEMISSGGQVVFIFAVYTTARNAKYYPVNVDFAVQYEGGFELEHAKSEFVIPEETDYLLQNKDYFYSAIEGKTWHNPAEIIGNKKVFISTNYKYNEKTRVYHKYDEEKYASDPYGYGAGYGPVLYADITVETRTMVLDTAFTLIEYKGNKALTVSNGTENYKLFIEGYSDVISNCPDSLKGTLAYAHVVNSDGAVPVTKELKDFLQKYSINQVMFMDGDGWAETGKTYGGESYEATENDQWLFACGYYE